MSDSTDPVVRDKWVARVLGLNVARVTSPMATPADSARPTSPLSPSPQTGLMAQASAQGALGKPVELPLTAQRKQIFKAASGREIDVRRGPDGSVALTAPQPPLREITFSGGGGRPVRDNPRRTIPWPATGRGVRRTHGGGGKIWLFFAAKLRKYAA